MLPLGLHLLIALLPGMVLCRGEDQSQFFGRYLVLTAKLEGLREAVTGFVAYFGTFDNEEATQKVVHHVEASLSPSWVGTDLKRSFRFDAGRLILTRPAPDT